LSSVGPPWLGCSLPVNQERRRVNRNSIGGHTNANPSSYWMEIKGQRWWCCVSRIYAGQSCPLGAIFPPDQVKYRTEKCIWMGLKWYCLSPQVYVKDFLQAIHCFFNSPFIIKLHW
jgi:hypothetical protein